MEKSLLLENLVKATKNFDPSWMFVKKIIKRIIKNIPENGEKICTISVGKFKKQFDMAGGTVKVISDTLKEIKFPLKSLQFSSDGFLTIEIN